MRISDWSSDVCSSDLGVGLLARDLLRSTFDPDRAAQRLPVEAQRRLRVGEKLLALAALVIGDEGDRKSVVWGQSVSVRVDVGVRSIIKKTKRRKVLRRIIPIHKNNMTTQQQKK